MDWESKEGRCMLACWAGAIVLGIVAYFILDTFLFKLLAQIGALLVILGAGVVLTQNVCVSRKAPEADPADLSPEAVAAPAAAPAPGSGGSAVFAGPGSGGAASVTVPADAETAEWDEAQESGSTAATSAVAYETPEGPELLDAPRGGTADDLKAMEGVGPKVEEALNGLGVWHYDQIAGWTEADVAWVEEQLPTLKGRAARDGWVAQAQKLAARDA